MKKKTGMILFVAACLAICLIPFACMTFARTDTRIGNEREVAFPSLTTKDNGFNTEILEELGSYFEQHFAFRPQLLSVDAEIQSNAFGVSNADTVIKGQNGWLYYNSTLDDYLGENTLSARGMWNLAHNISLMQDYVEKNDAKFLLMIPPNKNTLYGENMPYYDRYAVGTVRNRDLLQPALEKAGVAYLDLFSLFRDQEEVLYLKGDSHWNNKGALLVYNTALDQLQKDHDDYSDVPVVRKKETYGDLTTILYPTTAKPDWDYTYQYTQDYHYVTDTASVEDSHIETANSQTSDRLLMYRDSFGNTLLPFFANAFETACFSKSIPYNLVNDVTLYQPDYVVVEKVERNLREFVETPAVLPAPEVKLHDSDAQELSGATVTAEICEANMLYYAFSGEVTTGVQEETQIYLRLTDAAGVTKTYEAFTTTSGDSDNGFLVYLPRSQFDDPAGNHTVTAAVLTKTGETVAVAANQVLTLPQE